MRQHQTHPNADAAGGKLNDGGAVAVGDEALSGVAAQGVKFVPLLKRKHTIRRKGRRLFQISHDGNREQMPGRKTVYPDGEMKRSVLCQRKMRRARQCESKALALTGRGVLSLPGS